MNEKIKKREQLFYIGTFLLVLLMMTGIFCFSGEDASNSGARSEGICQEILSLAEKCFPVPMSKENRQMWGEKMETLLRKTAHFMEYTLLSFLVSLHVLARGLKKEKKKAKKDKGSLVGMIRKDLIRGLGFCALYACTDEFHQLFVPGRAGRLFDVGVDTAGACFGLVIFLTMPLQKVTMVLWKERDDSL